MYICKNNNDCDNGNLCCISCDELGDCIDSTKCCDVILEGDNVKECTHLEKVDEQEIKDNEQMVRIIQNIKHYGLGENDLKIDI